MPGEEGTWFFILGDMTIFAVFFGVYLWYRGQDPSMFEASQGELEQSFGAINTLVLLTSSLLVVQAVRAVRSGNPRRATPLLWAAVTCGAIFCLNKYLEYGEKIDHGITPGTNDFFMYFYVLTGLHLAHVVLGMVLLGIGIVLARKPGLSSRRIGYVEGIGCFWHMVDVLWIVLFPLLYLVH